MGCFTRASDFGVGEPPPELTRAFQEGFAIDVGFANPLDDNRRNTVNGVAAGDFNHDGWLDLASVFSERIPVAGSVGRVFHCLGPRRRHIPKPRGHPAACRGIGTKTVQAIGQGILARDCNGDGQLDLLVNSPNAQRVFWLQGHGDGTFAPPVASETAASPSLMQAADLNGDGNPRRSSRATTPPGAAGEQITVMLGAGDGTFSDLASFGVTVGSNYLDLTLADLDHANGPDVILAGDSNSRHRRCRDTAQ